MLELIVIFAHWCPTCNMMMPLAEEVVVDYAEKLETTWIDVEKHPEVMEEYEVELIPTFIFRCEGKEIARMAGMIGESALRERIEKNTCISRESII